MSTSTPKSSRTPKSSEIKKTCVSIPMSKFLDFKEKSARKFFWERGYTSKGVEEAIDLWTFFEDQYNNDLIETLEKIIKRDQDLKKEECEQLLESLEKIKNILN
ncbi:MAG: hypothetical protein K8E24_014070 [Methanobacterium paludis]|nr:hypothetical protein [Methanobacterium paludis]